MSSHTTRKSFKVDSRDKIRHSAAGTGEAKKGGGGGAFTWGLPGDELKYTEQLDPEDPNYDPMDSLNNGSNEGAFWSPRKSVQSRFVASVQDHNRFKKDVKTATDEYLLSNDFEEYQRIIESLDMGVYHQDISYILIKHSFDKSNQDRIKISALLQSLHDADIVSTPQMAQGFRKLYNHLHDIIVDNPAAKIYMQEFVSHATVSGYLPHQDATDMQEGVDMEADSVALARTKKLIVSFVEEYFESADVKDAAKSIREIKAVYHFEIVKKLVSMAFDRKDFHRERASVLLAAVAGDSIRLEAVEKGFEVLLERVEDLYLDVPTVQTLLSCFLARAVTDEALAPAFLARLDLADEDMGSSVVENAQRLLRAEKSAQRLSNVWGQAPNAF